MEIVKLRLNRDLTEEFKKYWGDLLNPMLHGKGWETWVRKGAYYRQKAYFEKNGDYNSFDNVIGGAILPENNKYGVNFPFSWFDVVE